MHERQVGLKRALEAAEQAWHEDRSEEAYARICELQGQLDHILERTLLTEWGRATADRHSLRVGQSDDARGRHVANATKTAGLVQPWVAGPWRFLCRSARGQVLQRGPRCESLTSCQLQCPLGSGPEPFNRLATAREIDLRLHGSQFQSGRDRWQTQQNTRSRTRQRRRPAERDSPLLDLSDQAVKRLIKAAQGARLRHLRRAERRAAVRGGLLRADRGHDGDALRHGHQRRRDRGGRGAHEPTPPTSRPTRRTTAARSPRRPCRPRTETRAEPTERTDDPVRMYLREMGSVELLSREGEIAIAKRIEAGRETMIAGLCESPLTFQAIIIWRDELNEGKILLRDIIDLEATYEGPEAKARRRRLPAAEAPREAEAEPARRGRAPPRRRRDGRRGRLRERAVARGHGGRAQAEGARDLRPHRRHLQEAAQAAGQEARAAGRGRARLAPAAEGLRQAARRDHRRRQEPVAQQQPHREPGRAALRHQQASWSASRAG